jgi:hypothetical protein
VIELRIPEVVVLLAVSHVPDHGAKEGEGLIDATRLACDDE